MTDGQPSRKALVQHILKVAPDDVQRLLRGELRALKVPYLVSKYATMEAALAAPLYVYDSDLEAYVENSPYEVHHFELTADDFR